MGPKVTIVLLSHRSWFLPGVIASIKAQTHTNVQIVMQHDEENWPTKFNEIASAAKGEWIIPLCDDDLLDPTYISECLRVSENADIVFTDRYMFQDGTKPWDGYRDYAFAMFGDTYTEKTAGPKGYFVTAIPPEFFTMGATLPMTCMIRRSWWEKLKGYDPFMPHADTEFWFRSSEAGARIHYIPEPLFWYRQHPEQYSQTHPSILAAMKAFHKKHFSRFGLLFEDAKHIEGPLYEVGYVEPEHRAQVEEFYLNRTAEPQG